MFPDLIERFEISWYCIVVSSVSVASCLTVTKHDFLLAFSKRYEILSSLVAK